VISPFVSCADDSQFLGTKIINFLGFPLWFFSELKLSTFWVSLFGHYPELSTKAIRAFLSFGSSYLCKLGDSSLTEMKSKKRNQLQEN
jgi:hypothetical protein